MVEINVIPTIANILQIFFGLTIPRSLQDCFLKRSNIVAVPTVASVLSKVLPQKPNDSIYTSLKRNITDKNIERSINA